MLNIGYPDDATVKVTIVGGATKDMVIPRGDHQLVVKIKDAQKQKIKLDITRNGDTGSITYDLSGLVLEKPSMDVKPVDEGESVLGKQVKDMQTGISVSDDAISGTLPYIKGFNQFNDDNPSDQQGHFLALDVNPPAGYSVTPELVGGDGESKKVTVSDTKIVFRITSNTTQSILITAQKESDKIIKTYSLTGLTLEPDRTSGDSGHDGPGV